MLRDAVRDAVAKGQFHIFTATHVEDVMERLCGLPAERLLDIFRRTGHPPELVIASRHCSPGVLQHLLKLSACPVILAAQNTLPDHEALTEHD
jgi:hypothetical protein